MGQNSSKENKQNNKSKIICRNSTNNINQIKIKSIKNAEIVSIAKVVCINNRLEFISMKQDKANKNKINSLIHGFIYYDTKTKLYCYSILTEYKCKIDTYGQYYVISDDLKYLFIWDQYCGHCTFIKLEQHQMIKNIQHNDKKHELTAANFDNKAFTWFYNENICDNILFCCYDFRSGIMGGHCGVTFKLYDPEKNKFMKEIYHGSRDNAFVSRYNTRGFFDFSELDQDTIKYWTNYGTIYSEPHVGKYNMSNYCSLNVDRNKCCYKSLLIDNDLLPKDIGIEAPQSDMVRLLSINNDQTLLMIWIKNKNHLKFIGNNDYEKFINFGTWNFNKIIFKEKSSSDSLESPSKNNQLLGGSCVKNNPNIYLLVTAKFDFNFNMHDIHQMYVFMNKCSKQKKAEILECVNSSFHDMIDLIFEYVGWELVSVFNLNDWLDHLGQGCVRYGWSMDFHYDFENDKLCFISNRKTNFFFIHFDKMLWCHDNVQFVTP